MFNTEIALTDSEFHKFRKLIYEIAGISLSDRKRELVKSRLARRLRAYDLASYSEYYDLLMDPQRSTEEIEHFTNALTTNKTEFFRESHHFDYLRNDFFPKLRQATLSGREKKLRIWCAAAATGQEPYTLAMTVRDYFGPQSDWDIRILCSDIDTQVLSKGREGIYLDNEMDGLSEGLRKKYFALQSREPEPTWRVKPELQELIAFRQINLIQPNWPINAVFDAIFCRNVMIYFDQPTQTRLVERFSEYLVPEGLLVIGHSESLFTITDMFEPLGDTIYKLKSSVRVNRRPAAALSSPIVTSTPVPNSVAPTRTSLPAAVPVDTRTTRVTNSDSTHQHRSLIPRTTPDAPAVYIPTKVLVVGEYEASREECMLQTVLGSCVAACLVDPANRVGGMNHFMLPEAADSDRVCASYGVHAMELLINAIMKLGGSRRQLLAKIFGGGCVVGTLRQGVDVGQRNVEFVKRFLETERIPIAGEHVLGEHGRRVKFIPTTGKVYVSLLGRTDSIDADKANRSGSALAWQASLHPPTSSVTMFRS